MAETEIWTIKAALEWTCGYLARKGDENPRLAAEWLLAEACGMRRIELYVNYERPLSMSEREVLRGYVTRRGRGEPLQYITGEVGFRLITLKVRPGVLIPRPETEVLVSEVLKALPAAARPRAAEFLAEQERDAAGENAEEDGPGAGGAGVDAEVDVAAGSDAAGVIGAYAGTDSSAGVASAPDAGLLVADVCTGSGCIACSLAFEHADVRVVATDLSSEAVELARENVRILGLDERVSVVACNLGDGIDPALLGTFDAVVSNPPYVPTSVLADVPREVADFEPVLALDGGEDGLDLFRPLVTWAHAALKPGGVFAVELHEGHLDKAASIARTAGFSDVREVCDLAGRPRVLTARA